MSDLAARLAALTRLADAKNSAIPESQMRSYLTLLEDVPLDYLVKACLRLARAATYGFPQVGEIRLAAGELQRDAFSDALKQITGKVDENDRRRWVHCRDCDDDPGAWLPCWCPGFGAQKDEDAIDVMSQKTAKRIESCGRDHAHAPHPFVKRCACHMADWRQERRGPRAIGEDLRRPA